MIENSITFMEYRRGQEQSIHEKNKIDDGFSAVLTVEINITELCNRVCSFCPRADSSVYPNQKLFISDEILNKIIDDLKKVEYRGKVSFSGFGEPLLNKNFVKIIKNFRKNLNKDVILETNTNGDRLTPELLRELFEGGLNGLYWNLYDGPEQIEIANKIIEASNVDASLIRLRPHWVGYDSNQEWGLFLNNRSGAVVGDYLDGELPLRRKCFYPFYKLFIDWNGNVLFCSNDWLRKKIIGNVLSKSLGTLWLDDIWNEYRIKLLKEDRSEVPCSTCDVNGLLFGEKSSKILEKYFTKT